MIHRSIELGPIHPWLPGAMKLGIGLQGDRIQSCDVEFGYQSKSIKEKILGQNIFWAQGPISHLEPEQALILDTLFSEAIEEFAGLEVSDRTQWIRDAAVDLSDLSIMLRYLAVLGKAMEIPILSHILLKHREDLLDLIELLCGSRYGFYFIIPCGTRYDLSEGFRERFSKWAKNILADMGRIEEFFFWAPEFSNSMKKLGIVVDSGINGFISRSANQSSRMGSVSSVYSRTQLAIEGIQMNTKRLLERIEESHSKFEQVNFPQDQLQGGETEATIDTFRGEWKMFLKWNAKKEIIDFKCTTPSMALVPAMQSSVEGELFDQLGVILHSLCFRVSEVDQ